MFRKPADCPLSFVNRDSQLFTSDRSSILLTGNTLLKGVELRGFNVVVIK